MSINVRALTGFRDFAEGPTSRPPAARKESATWRSTRRHSRIVRVLRLALPALAFIVVASMFVSVRTMPKGIGDIDLGEVGLNGTTLTMQNPSLSGFNENGTSYQVTADKALQDVTNPRVVTLEQISGTMTNPDGSNVEVTARDGVFDADAQKLDLTNRIVVRTDGGESAFLESAHIDMQAGTISSTDPVRAQTRAGRIRANAMEISERGSHLLFTGKVVVELRMDGGPLDGESDRAQGDSRRSDTVEEQTLTRESGSDDN